jgi:hypothetical protein
LVAIAVLAAGAVVVAGLALVWLTSHGGSSTPAEVQNQQPADDNALPPFILNAAEPVAVAYKFALDRPDIMMWMPCYCGCGGHSGHKNARDCFVNPGSTSGDVQFDQHGSECDVCVDIALRAREMTEAGVPLPEIRTAVDAEFGDIGPGTDTPLPPQ